MKKITYQGKIKFILGIILGIILARTGVYALTTIVGSNVDYSNIKSELKSTNVQEAIDELYEKADIRKLGRFIAAYTYNESEANKCITGEEETCKKTTCYQDKTANSCKAGTIIRYMVNDTDIINFHVMFDEGNTMVMQSQRNLVYNTKWYGQSGKNSEGPTTILPVLENITKGWSNVNNQTYTLGTTSLSEKGEQTGCDDNELNCTTNTYTLTERTAKARMITVQEAKALGCTRENKSCPIWMYNYLTGSKNMGGTMNDPDANYYWTLSANSSFTNRAFTIHCNGHITGNYTNVGFGIRAVIVVSK